MFTKALKRTVIGVVTVLGVAILIGVGDIVLSVIDDNRPNWQSATAPTADEMKSTLLGPTDFTAYCSTVEVHAKDGFVLHHVELDKSPNIVGRTRKRWFTLQGNRLTLRVDTSELPATLMDWTLVWERVERGA